MYANGCVCLIDLWGAYVMCLCTRSYGDKTPRTVAGRIYGLMWITTGIGIMAIFTATLVTSFSSEFIVINNIEGMKASSFPFKPLPPFSH